MVNQSTENLVIRNGMVLCQLCNMWASNDHLCSDEHAANAQVEAKANEKIHHVIEIVEQACVVEQKQGSW